MADNQLLSITQVSRLKNINPNLLRYYIKKGYMPFPQIQAGRKVWPIEQIGDWNPPILKVGRPLNPKGDKNDT